MYTCLVVTSCLLVFSILWQLFVVLVVTQVLRAQENVTVLQKAVLALLIIEGLLVLVLAVGLVARLLKGISVHRQALFSVFLAIPNSYLRTLASRSINIGEEGDEDEGKCTGHISLA